VKYKGRQRELEHNRGAKTLVQCEKDLRKKRQKSQWRNNSKKKRLYVEKEKDRLTTKKKKSSCKNRDSRGIKIKRTLDQKERPGLHPQRDQIDEESI